jgi:hypothetical protein
MFPIPGMHLYRKRIIEMRNQTKSKINTPKGTFRTLQEAGEAHGITREGVRRKIENKRKKEWYRGSEELTEAAINLREEDRQIRSSEEYQQLIGEDWRKHPKWPLMVSSDGRVLRWKVRGCEAYWTEVPQASSNGYYHIRVTISTGKLVQDTVHRLVGETFLIRGLGDEINHMDGDKSNNCVSNLEWCTSQENILHYYLVVAGDMSVVEYKASRPLEYKL